jgi:hypothetical protein
VSALEYTQIANIGCLLIFLAEAEDKSSLASLTDQSFGARCSKSNKKNYYYHLFKNKYKRNNKKINRRREQLLKLLYFNCFYNNNNNKKLETSI